MKRKKLSSILLFVLCIAPINVFACPHIDSEGGVHLQTYNETYTKMNMIYPMDNYLYTKEVTMILDGVYPVANEDEILSETFSFPVYQLVTSYITYYWFLDSSLLESDIEQLDVKTTVEGVESMYVEGGSYHLEVGLPNSFNESQNYINEYSDQLFYAVKIVTSNDYETYEDRLSELNLVLIEEDILSINAEFMITEVDNYVYETTYEAIDELYDYIEVGVPTDESEYSLIVINLDEAITEDDIIYPEYVDNHYIYEINNSGNYALAYKTSDELINEIIESTDEESESEYLNLNDVIVEEENNNLIYIISGIVGTIIVIATVLLIVLKKKK